MLNDKATTALIAILTIVLSITHAHADGLRCETRVFDSTIPSFAVYDTAIGNSTIFSTSFFSEGISIYDISDIGDPTEIGFIPIESGDFIKLLLRDGYLYALFDADGLGTHSMHVYDVHNPSAPVLTHEYELNRFVRDIEFENGLLCVLDSTTLHIFTLEDPAIPTKIGEHPIQGTGVEFELNDGAAFAYIRLYNALRRIDLSDPSAPVRTGSIPTGNSDFELSYDSGYLYLANTNGDLKVFDTTTPNFTLSDTLDLWISQYSTVRDGIVYSQEDQALRLIDIHNQNNPVVIGSRPGVSRPDVWFNDDHVLFESSFGLMLTKHDRLLEPYDPQTSTFDITGMYNANGRAMAAAGDHLYLPNDGLGIGRIDLTDPAAPIFSSFSPSTNAPIQLERIDDLLLAVTGLGEFLIFDVSNPANPTLLSTTTFGAIHGKIAIDGSRIAWIDSTDALTMLDITDPSNPALSAPIPLDLGSFFQFNVYTALKDDTFYHTTNETLRSIDVSDPMNPILIEEVPLVQFGYPDGLERIGDTLFLAQGGECVTEISAIDISNPIAMNEVGFFDLEQCYEMTLSTDGESLYASSESILYILDPSDPSDMRVVGWHWHDGAIFTAHATQSNVVLTKHYFNTGSNGFVTMLSPIDQSDCPYKYCRANLFPDQSLDIFDIQIFLSMLTSSDPGADLNRDGDLDFFDLSQYLRDFQDGCE